MQYHWLHKNINNNKLIVFFGGWSFDFRPFECLESNNYDVLMFYDYNNLEIPPEIPDYEEKILITWSMGVFIAYYLKDKLPEFNRKIAINGTPYPVDNERGIPFRTFDLTLKHAQTGLKQKFYENVFANEEFLKKYLKTPVERTIQNRVEELNALNTLIKNTPVTYDGKFYDRAIVSNNDKIIPFKNQMNMWQNLAKVIDCGHFPFYNYKSWDEICN